MEIDVACTLVEKAMVTLNPTLSSREQQQYLGGYIDCLGEQHLISEEDREALYFEYCPCEECKKVSRCGRIVSRWQHAKFTPFFVFIIAFLHSKETIASKETAAKAATIAAAIATGYN